MKDLPDPLPSEALRETAHAQSWKDVVLHLGVSEQQGLSMPEVKTRLEQYGPNALKEPPRPGPIRGFLAQFADFLVLILIGATAVSAFLGEIVVRL